MTQDPARELADLMAVHGFYVSVLEEAIGHELPIPAEVSSAEATTPEGLAASLNIARRWLSLLDLAASVSLIRTALSHGADGERVEALLRYLVQKASRSSTDRDKTDLVATHLYRAWASGGATGLDRAEFEKQLCRILHYDSELSLPDEHRQLAREFEFVRQEIDEFRHFDKLMDSGLMTRVREIKESFGTSFYHPHVLATIAEYNVFFGDKFAELFREASHQIKTFAAKVMREGGSIMSRVDGDVIVKDLTEVEENSLLTEEYQRAKDDFRHLSKLKKAIDTRSGHRAGMPIPPRVAATPAPAVTPTLPNVVRNFDIGTLAEVPGRTMSETIEQTKLHSMEETIRNFVRAAEPTSAQLVPLRAGKVNLTLQEMESFRADFGSEKSFRSDFAVTHRTLVALSARMITELADFHQKRDSAYLWKPHADSLAYLLKAAQQRIEQTDAVIEVARQRGLTDKITALDFSVQKLRSQMQLVARTLESISPAQSAGKAR